MNCQKGATILVTGASGFIGSEVIKNLIEKRYPVIGIDAKDPIDNLSGSLNFTFLRADISNKGPILDEPKNTDVLIHCAALVHNRSDDLSKNNYFSINYDGTRNILSFLDKDKVKHIIFLSTVSVYGDSANISIVDENTRTAPADYYGESKLAAESAVKYYCQSYGIHYSIFRLVPVYGDSFLLNVEKRTCLPGKTAFYKIGSGEQRLSLVSINNVVDVIVGSINNPVFLDRTFIVKDLQDYSINEIISVLKECHSHMNKPVLSIPTWVPTVIFKFKGLFPGKKGKCYEAQFKKIASDAVFSGTKLFSTGVELRWDLRTTLMGRTDAMTSGTGQ